jgi:hypothetical protein
MPAMADIIPLGASTMTMPNKTEEQARDSRELTTQELETVTGGMFIAAGVAALLARQNPRYKCAVDPMACQW